MEYISEGNLQVYNEKPRKTAKYVVNYNTKLTP
jgi:hypothetical protein